MMILPEDTWQLHDLMIPWMWTPGFVVHPLLLSLDSFYSAHANISTNSANILRGALGFTQAQAVMYRNLANTLRTEHSQDRKNLSCLLCLACQSNSYSFGGGYALMVLDEAFSFSLPFISYSS